MKRLLIALVAVVALSGAVMASGPVIGFGVEPVQGAAVSVDFGWGFNTWTILAEKESLGTFYGPWAIAALWNPYLSGLGSESIVEGRFGGELGINWQETGLYYDDFSLIVGAQLSWQIITGYLQLEVGGSGTIMPKAGVEIQFNLPGTTGGTE